MGNYRLLCSCVKCVSAFYCFSIHWTESPFRPVNRTKTATFTIEAPRYPCKFTERKVGTMTPERDSKAASWCEGSHFKHRRVPLKTVKAKMAIPGTNPCQMP